MQCHAMAMFLADLGPNVFWQPWVTKFGMRLNAAVDEFAKVGQTAMRNDPKIQSCLNQRFWNTKPSGKLWLTSKNKLIMAVFCSISIQASTSRKKRNPFTAEVVSDSLNFSIWGGPLAASSPPMEYCGLVRPQWGLTAMQAESQKALKTFPLYLLTRCQLKDLKIRGVQPAGKQVTYNSLIAACHRGSQWQRALIVLKELDPCNNIMHF